MNGMLKTGIFKIRLTQFRSYESLSLNLPNAFCPVVLTGHNGAGKTNVLEAISFLTAGRGLRSARLSDVARRLDGEVPLGVETLPVRWAVSASVEVNGNQFDIGTGTVDGSDRRQIRIDGKNISKQAELARVFRCLWLTPAQDRLFCGDPASRRRFLDRLVQVFDPAHADRLSDYSAAFKQWSCLLREGRIDTVWLTSLEEQMATLGVAIAAERLDMVARLMIYLRANVIDYFPQAEITLTGVVEQALTEKSAVYVEEEFAAYLKKMRHVYADGGSVQGPHTADFKVFHRQKNLSGELCSTGEQKALLISIILSQMAVQMKEQGMCPVLLFDEAAVHLDARRRQVLFEVLADLPAQVWMTGTEESAFKDLSQKAHFLTVEESIVNDLKVA